MRARYARPSSPSSSSRTTSARKFSRLACEVRKFFSQRCTSSYEPPENMREILPYLKGGSDRRSPLRSPQRGTRESHLYPLEAAILTDPNLSPSDGASYEPAATAVGAGAGGDAGARPARSSFAGTGASALVVPAGEALLAP